MGDQKLNMKCEKKRINKNDSNLSASGGRVTSS